MRFHPVEPPRRFPVGARSLAMSDCGQMEAEPDEQVTFVTPGGAEYDVARKAWGFYATPSTDGRLAAQGWRTAVARNAQGRHYVLLAERARLADLDAYLAAEHMRVVAWLDETADLARIDGRSGAGRACVCGATDLELAWRYEAPPACERPLPGCVGSPYPRDLLRCRACGHFLAVHELDEAALYAAGYVDANYGDAAGIQAAFERIVALPPERSDNAGRVRRVLAFAAECGAGDGSAGRSVLDIGSGLCVFLHGMRAAGWRCLALDPDDRAAEHARAVVGVEALCGDLLASEPGGPFAVVTLNRVLEHVADPIAMLRRAGDLVADGGFLYVEVPDGETAAQEGFEREEFTLDHRHAFSAASLSLTAMRAGLDVARLERLREPSGKRTLLAFLNPAGSACPAGAAAAGRSRIQARCREDDPVYLAGEQQYREPKAAFVRVLDRIAARAGDRPLSLVDVGCASGAFLHHAAQRLRLGAALGIDVSPALLDAARAAVPAARFARASISDPAFAPPGRFDVCTCLGTMSLFDDLGVPLTNLLRLVAPGGRLLILDTVNPHGVDVLLRHRRSATPLSAWEVAFNARGRETYERFLRRLLPRCRWSWHPFRMPFALPPSGDPLRAWTMATEEDPHQLVVGTGMLLTFEILEVAVEGAN